jgi:hypothetical protein
MKLPRFSVALCLAVCLPAVVQARVWTDASGHYKLEAELIAFNDHKVVVQRADHDLVAFPLEQLSDADREYLKSKEAGEAADKLGKATQTWSLRDGAKLEGRLVDYAEREVTIQRRRGRVYVNDRNFENLPEFYRPLVVQIVAHFEKLPSADRAAFDAWVLAQRGQPRTFPVEGVLLEAEGGDEFAVPFFLLSEADQKVLEPGLAAWREAHRGEDRDSQTDLAFLLESLAAARHQDHLVQRDIALVQLNLQAVQAGLTSLWEVTLFPAVGQVRPPIWVVVPGRDSRQAMVMAMQKNPGYMAGPVRRVSNTRF